MAYDIETTDEFDAWHEAIIDPVAKKAISRGLVKLAGGLFGNVRSVGDGVSEYKVDVGAGYRAYFVTRERTIIVMLCGGDKSTQAQDIVRAKGKAKDL